MTKDASVRAGTAMAVCTQDYTSSTMPAHQKSNINWAAIRKEFESGKACRAISKEMKDGGTPVSHVAIAKRARKEGWSETWKPDVSKTLTARKFAEPITHADKLQVAAAVRSPQNLERILTFIGQGMSPSAAAATAGVSPSIMTAWRKEDPTINQLIADARYAYFGTREQNVHEAGNRGDLRANLAILERAPEMSEFWQAKSPQGHGGPNIQVVLNVNDPKDVTRLETRTLDLPIPVLPLGDRDPKGNSK